MSCRSVVIDTEYWGNRLEVGIDLVLDQHADDHHMQVWTEGLSPTFRSILAQRLGIASGQSLAEIQRGILMHRGELLQYLLLDAAAQNTRMHAIVEVARSQLPATQLPNSTSDDGSNISRDWQN